MSCPDRSWEGWPRFARSRLPRVSGPMVSERWPAVSAVKCSMLRSRPGSAGLRPLRRGLWRDCRSLEVRGHWRPVLPFRSVRRPRWPRSAASTAGRDEPAVTPTAADGPTRARRGTGRAGWSRPRRCGNWPPAYSNSRRPDGRLRARRRSSWGPRGGNCRHRRSSRRCHPAAAPRRSRGAGYEPVPVRRKRDKPVCFATGHPQAPQAPAWAFGGAGGRGSRSGPSGAGDPTSNGQHEDAGAGDHPGCGKSTLTMTEVAVTLRFTLQS